MATEWSVRRRKWECASGSGLCIPPGLMGSIGATGCPWFGPSFSGWMRAVTAFVHLVPSPHRRVGSRLTGFPLSFGLRAVCHVVGVSAGLTLSAFGPISAAVYIPS